MDMLREGYGKGGVVTEQYDSIMDSLARMHKAMDSLEAMLRQSRQSAPASLPKCGALIRVAGGLVVEIWADAPVPKSDDRVMPEWTYWGSADGDPGRPFLKIVRGVSHAAVYLNEVAPLLTALTDAAALLVDMEMGGVDDDQG